jgi:DNA-binding transcriptional regulator YiaG
MPAVLVEGRADCLHHRKPWLSILPSQRRSYEGEKDHRSECTEVHPTGAGPMSPEALKEWRVGARLTQQQVADDLGVAMETVCRWETGVLPMRRMTVLAIERLMEVRSDH